MSGLALVCRQLGAEVSGSDRAESSYLERLRAAGIEPDLGHDAEQVPDGRRGGRLHRRSPRTTPSWFAPASAASG